MNQIKTFENTEFGTVRKEGINMTKLPEVEFVAAEDVADLLHTTQRKVHAAVLNGTFPVGIAVEGGKGERARTIIVKERLIAWLTAQDLKGV